MMEATQNHIVVKPKTRNVESQQNTELGGSRRNTKDYAGARYRQGESNKEGGAVRYDLMKENAALKAQLEDSQFKQHLFHCKWTAAERKFMNLEVLMEEIRKTKCFESERKIKVLKEQLEQSVTTEARLYDQKIHMLRFELSEARIERINAVNRLILADKIMASLNLKLNEANKKLQQQKSKPASQTDLTPGSEKKAATQNSEQPEEGAENLQQQLLKAQKDLEEQAAKHKEEQEALCREFEQLRAKLCTNEARKDKNQEEAPDFAQLEQQQDNYTMAAQKRAEEDEESPQHSLQERGITVNH